MDAGYCDYFATAMAVLARAVGVPARVATGYWTGAYDPELGFYVVTGLDAHAWGRGLLSRTSAGRPSSRRRPGPSSSGRRRRP